jgi:hypothetical protein
VLLAGLGQDLIEVAEVGVKVSDIARASESGPQALQGFFIAVQQDQPSARPEPVQQRRRMPPAAGRPVNDRLAGFGPQMLDGFGEHHGHMADG